MNQDVIGQRTQVAKHPRWTSVKDKLLFGGVVVVCLLIGLGNLLPKHKTTQAVMPDEKQDARMALNQNMELIATLQHQQEQPHVAHQTKLRSLYEDALSKETLARMNAPSTLFTASAGEASAVSNDTENKTLTGLDANSAFLNQQNDITTVFAKQIPHPSLTVPAGEMIPATLDTAIHSELAGMARAITTRDIYALSGNKLLIPKGSTLIGQFNAAVTEGQSRIFVVWDRLQVPNGVIVTLNSPSADIIGRTGQAADYIDRHFFARFGTGTLLSVLGAYTAVGGVNGQDEYNSLSQYRMNIAGSFQQAANQTLKQDMQLKPVLQINQGTAINIFVAHDLDFHPVAKRI